MKAKLILLLALLLVVNLSPMIGQAQPTSGPPFTVEHVADWPTSRAIATDGAGTIALVSQSSDTIRAATWTPALSLSDNPFMADISSQRPNQRPTHLIYDDGPGLFWGCAGSAPGHTQIRSEDGLTWQEHTNTATGNSFTGNCAAHINPHATSPETRRECVTLFSRNDGVGLVVRRNQGNVCTFAGGQVFGGVFPRIDNNVPSTKTEGDHIHTIGIDGDNQFLYWKGSFGLAEVDTNIIIPASVDNVTGDHIWTNIAQEGFLIFGDKSDMSFNVITTTDNYANFSTAEKLFSFPGSYTDFGNTRALYAEGRLAFATTLRGSQNDVWFGVSLDRGENWTIGRVVNDVSSGTYNVNMIDMTYDDVRQKFIIAFRGTDAATYIAYATADDIEALIDGIEPPLDAEEFSTGFKTFISNIGFISPESQFLFSIILIGLAIVITGMMTQLLGEIRLRRDLAWGAGILTGVFCVVVFDLQLWMFVVAVVLGAVMMFGIGPLGDFSARPTGDVPVAESPAPGDTEPAETTQEPVSVEDETT